MNQVTFLGLVTSILKFHSGLVSYWLEFSLLSVARGHLGWNRVISFSSFSTMNLCFYCFPSGGGEQAWFHQGLPERDDQGGRVLWPQTCGADTRMAYYVLQPGAVSCHTVDGQQFVCQKRLGCCQPQLVVGSRWPLGPVVLSQEDGVVLIEWLQVSKTGFQFLLTEPPACGCRAMFRYMQWSHSQALLLPKHLTLLSVFNVQTK